MASVGGPRLLCPAGNLARRLSLPGAALPARVPVGPLASRGVVLPGFRLATSSVDSVCWPAVHALHCYERLATLSEDSVCRSPSDALCSCWSTFIRRPGSAGNLVRKTRSADRGDSEMSS